ncbi:YncE family protein [Inmirania thermothiophila]|uniref:YVTN family beta-propeller protein n=1 Tax=Inmirania thermothiophila TaxID=1750597 RepID=A0A3N1Y6D7_9GAMM|nr:YncE family protein [Inmirania thermothiophila]ROR34386.1 hypothetical protein EDC57_0282 [Inmirania thermothiophila]
MSTPSFRPLRRLMAVLAFLGAAASAEPLVYVPTGEANRLVAVDLARGAVTAAIDGVVASHGLAYAPEAGVLIAGSFQTVAPAGMPARPAGVSQSEHEAHHRGGGDASASGLVYLVDVATGAIRRQVPVAGPVHHVLALPGGRWGVATHPTGGGISVVDLQTGRMAARVATGPAPNYAVASADGGRVWVSNTGNGTVSEIDTGRWIVRRNIVVEGGPEHMALSRDARRLFVVAAETGEVVEIDLPAGVVAARYAVGRSPHGLALSADGRQVFVAVNGEDKLVALRPDERSMRTLALAPRPYHVTVAPDNRILVTSSADGRLWLVDADPLAVRSTLQLGAVGHQMALVP